MGNIIRLRNKRTGEFKDVDDSAQEFVELKAQVGPSGQSVWEQTGDHHAREVLQRAEDGTLRETDLGHDQQADLRFVTEPNEELEVADPDDLILTAGEVEAGLTPEDKAKAKAEVLSRNNNPVTETEARVADATGHIKSESDTSLAEQVTASSGARRRRGQNRGKATATSASSEGSAS